MMAGDQLFVEVCSEMTEFTFLPFSTPLSYVCSNFPQKAIFMIRLVSFWPTFQASFGNILDCASHSSALQAVSSWRHGFTALLLLPGFHLWAPKQLGAQTYLKYCHV
jgi:hypothetical protein